MEDVMSKLSNRWMGSLFAAALAAGSTTASAAVWDFQSDAVGSAPTNGVIFSSINNPVEVVNDSSTPSDPFGGTGNKSLWMEDTNTTNSTLTFNVGGPGYAAGTISAKIYVVSDQTNTFEYFDINGGTGNANTGAGDIGPWIQYIPDLYGFRAYTSSGAVYFTNSVPHNTVIDLVVQFDAATDTFTGTINGSALTDGTNTTFNFYNSLSTLSSVRIVNGQSTQDSGLSTTTFYDDITLVPEPSSMMLLGLGALALVGRKRRA